MKTLPGPELLRVCQGDYGTAREWGSNGSLDPVFGKGRWPYAHWTLNGNGRDSNPTITMCAVMTDMTTNIVLCRIDQDALASYQGMGLPEALAVHVYTAFPLGVNTDEQGREVLHWLARSAVQVSGPDLLIQPVTPAAQQDWAMAADAAVRCVMSGGDLSQLEIVAF